MVSRPAGKSGEEVAWLGWSQVQFNANAVNVSTVLDYLD